MINVSKLFATLGVCAALMLGAATSPLGILAGQDDASKAGGKLYTKYCASCHGVDAKGGGPAAPALKTPPSDLTIIQKPGEPFPTFKIMTVIEGEKVIAPHGSREMPVWGTIFRRTEDAARGRSNVYTLTKYIESIQANK
jgi:mono/diheme cytochrome c family protein